MQASNQKRSYKYYICDVFTKERFGGNQLAVIPEAEGIEEKILQKIAREFNFSETVFVSPPEKNGNKKVRIFAPTQEFPFAGHPNIGASFVLATIGAFGTFDQEISVCFEEMAGIVPIRICKKKDGTIISQLTAPETITIGANISKEIIARALSLTPGDIVTSTHPPQIASVGLPFIMVELQNTNTLQKARISFEGFQIIKEQGLNPCVFIYTSSYDQFDIRSRMFAPFEGVMEDPATGSANCALAGLLASYDSADSGTYQWKVAQGIEMGRPSLLTVSAEKENGKIISTKVAGTCVMVGEGVIYLD